MATRKQWQWCTLSLILLAIYLGFFHLCLGSSYPTCMALGVGGWLLWSAICVGARSVFRNRFEYLIHLLVGFDILLEGFSPIHGGYGFYLCAVAFWAIFLTYHYFAGSRTVVCPKMLQPEFADSSLVG